MSTIPKRLIYAMYGNMKVRPEVEQKCIESWSKMFPKDEWEWVKLDEVSCPVSTSLYAQKAYDKKYFGFCADWARVKTLYELGGVYVDTDQLMFKPLTDDILNNDMIMGSCMHKDIDGSQKEIISWGLVGCCAGNDFMRELLSCFEIDDSYEMSSSRLLLMEKTRKLLLQYEHVNKKDILGSDKPCKYEHMTIYPFDHFTCTFWNSDKVIITDRSYGMHLYGSSWKSNKFKLNAQIKIQNKLRSLN